MTGTGDSQQPEWMAEIEQRLTDERASLNPLELDRIKQTAIGRASKRGGAFMNLRSRLVTVGLAVVLVGSGGTAVYAVASGSSSNGSAAQSQYCPKTGKPKHDTGRGHEKGGNKCGQTDSDSH
jgi:hypothetical protein